jgi:XTP/dITP diphosphohydrolase
VETARYAGPQRDADANMTKLLGEMARREKEAAMARTNGMTTAKATRSARFRTSVTLIVGGQHHFFDGVMEGRIAQERAGEGGFGYDPVFIPEGYNLTNAQLGEEVKNTISHRGKALRAMADYLRG